MNLAHIREKEIIQSDYLDEEDNIADESDEEDIADESCFCQMQKT